MKAGCRMPRQQGRMQIVYPGALRQNWQLLKIRYVDLLIVRLQIIGQKSLADRQSMRIRHQSAADICTVR